MVNGDREMVWKHSFIINFPYLFTSLHRSTGDVWFGLSLSGDYVHEDGTVVTSGSYASSWYNDPWGSSEPSRGSSELCVRLRNRGFANFDWADYGCGSQFNYLCKGMETKILES